MLSAYNKFVKKHIKGELVKGKNPTDAMKAVAKLWRQQKHSPKRSGAKRSKRSGAKRSKRSTRRH
jgi:hypothetical protein